MTDPRDVPEDEVEVVEEPPVPVSSELFTPLIDEPAADDSPDEGDDPDPDEAPDLNELPDEVRDDDIGATEPEET